MRPEADSVGMGSSVSGCFLSDFISKRGDLPVAVRFDAGLSPLPDVCFPVSFFTLIIV